MADGAVSETRSCFLHGDYTGKDKCPTCQGATGVDEADHCACVHDGRGLLVSECEEHRQIREERDAMLAVLKDIVRAYDGPTVDAATAVSSHMQAARMAIAKAEG